MPYSLIMEGSLRGLLPNPLPAHEQWMLNASGWGLSLHVALQGQKYNASPLEMLFLLGDGLDYSLGGWSEHNFLLLWLILLIGRKKMDQL